MKYKIKNLLKEKWLILIIIIFAILKQISVININQWYDIKLVNDDMLMLKYTVNLYNGDYLGAYDYMTLTKGIGFSLFILLLLKNSIIYPIAYTFLNTLSVIYFVYALKDVLKNKISLLILYLVMLFNPISYDKSVFVQLYNTGIQKFQLNFIIAGYFILLTRRNGNKKYLLLNSFILTFFTIWFYINRTDSIYILPFIIVATSIITFFIIKENFKESKKNLIILLSIAILPIFGIVVSKNIIVNINYKYYGSKIYNEYTDSNSYFNKFLKQLNSISTDENIEYCTNTNKKMKLIFENSDTLKEIEDEYFEQAKRWGTYDRKPRDGEVEDGWFYWCIKESYHKAKKPKNSKEADEFWKKVYNELDIAIKNNKFKMQFAFPIMVSPWRNGYGIKLTKASLEILKYSINFKGIDISYVNSNNISDIQRIFLKGDYFVYSKIIQVLFIISIFSYFFVLLNINKKCKNRFYICILTTAIMLNIILWILGSAYTHISAFNMIKISYLTPIYNMLIPFIFINILYFMENINLKEIIVKKEK